MDTIRCNICGNTNYVDGVANKCVACNWMQYAGDTHGFRWDCPVCDNKNMGDYPEYDVCPLCNWEDDHLQRDDPDYWGGANDLSLNDYRAEWQKRKSAQANELPHSA